MRLMVGLHYLKYAFDESDEALVERWVENPYWQYFCGFTHMQYECPIHPTSMTKWRNRVGAERLEALLKETIDLAQRAGFVRPSDLKRVNVDTTVQEKNITYPTDAKLLYRAIEKLGAAAQARGIDLRQSYIRVGKKMSIKASRDAHARQFKRMKRSLRKLRTFVARLIRDIERKSNEPDAALTTLLQRADRIRTQQPKDKNKLYSLHEPEVQCISKGKAHKRYEFGQKIAIATTNRDNWIVAAQLFEGNPYDGHTLGDTLTTVEAITGVPVTDAYVDRGYRGYGCGDADRRKNKSGGKIDLSSDVARNDKRNDDNVMLHERQRGKIDTSASNSDVDVNQHIRSRGERYIQCHSKRRATLHVHIAGQRKKNTPRCERRRRNRRSAVEPKIGHFKSDNRMDRCFLAGLDGDAINAILAAAGSNLRKLLRRFAVALIQWLSQNISNRIGQRATYWAA